VSFSFPSEKMNHRDTFNIICSFLTPLELVKVSVLSYRHKIWSHQYILKKIKKINMEEYVCPRCGDWISEDILSNYTDFNDYYLTDDMKFGRLEQLNEWFNNKFIFNIDRKALLCDICENEEDYTDNFYAYFRYKGSREYTLVSYYNLHSWSALCIINSDCGYWNEYRKVLSCSFNDITQSIGFYGDNNLDWDTWDNDEDDEDDEDDNY